MSTQNKQGLNYILQAINNIVEPRVENLQYDKTYRAKITEVIDAGVYKVQINNVEYQLSYNGELSVGDIVKVKAPLNNFSDIYIEALPGSGGGGGGTGDYNELTNKPVLNSNNSTAQIPASNEIIKGTISLHKISKTGNYDDLNNKPSLDFIPNSEKGAANGVATLDDNSKLTNSQLPIATTGDLGVIKVGENLSISSDGTLSATGGGISDYNELNNKPILNTNNTTAQEVQESETIQSTIALHKISKTGSYDDLNDKPDLDFIPNSEKGAANGVATLDINTRVSKNNLPIDIVYDDDYVHTDNNFTDTLKSKLNGIENGAQVNKIEKITQNGVELSIANKTVNITTPTKVSELENDSGFVQESSLAQVATTGSYNDLIDKPTIPTVNDGILTIQKNGTTINTFSANSSDDVNVNIEVPIKVSDLENDSGFISEIPIASQNILGGIKVGENLVIDTDGTLNAIAGGSAAVSDTLPIGAVVEWYGERIPINWLICDGREVSRTEYAELFKVLGTTYGEGDGSTTFNLPDIKGKVQVGLDGNDSDFDVLGKTGGEKEHVLTLNEIPSHSHTFTGTSHFHQGINIRNYEDNAGGWLGMEKANATSWNTSNANSTAGVYQYNGNKGYFQAKHAKTSNATATGTIGNSGEGQSHNNLQPYIVTNYIIKAYQIAPITAIVEDNLISTSSINALSANQGRILNEKIANNSDDIVDIQDELDTAIENISTLQDDVSGIKTDINNLDANKLEIDNIIAGNNITINKSNNNATINAVVPTQTSDLVNNGSDGTSVYVEASELGTASTKNIGTSSGEIPILDSNGKLAESVIPAMAITEVFVVNSEASMLALDAQVGDVAVRTDINKNFILQQTPATTLSNWVELLVPTDSVLSVNTKTGNVVLTSSDINVGSTEQTITEKLTELTNAIAGAGKRFTQIIGNGIDNTFVINHSLNSDNCIIQVSEANSPYAVVIPDIELTSENTCTIKFREAPSANQYKVNIIG